MQITGDTEYLGHCKEKHTKQYINIVLAKLFELKKKYILGGSVILKKKKKEKIAEIILLVILKGI